MWRVCPALLIALLLLPAAEGADAIPAASPSAGTAGKAAMVSQLHALLINGGGAPAENYRSHVLHLEELVRLLGRVGVPLDRMAVLASDGEHPAPDVATRGHDPADFWLLLGTGVERLLEEPIRYESTSLPGLDLRPATRASVHRWFSQARGRLQSGDTLFLYVTDHGKDDPRDPRRNHITLWGRRQWLTVGQLSAQLERLRPGVRVVTLMSQCFSGGFTHLLDVRARAKLPSGAACGYFASTHDRPAYGCYPEATRFDRSGHSFAMFDALQATGSLQQAHAETLVNDQTPDVPLRTSDAFLSELLRRAAEADGRDERRLTDRLLAVAQRLTGVEELGLVDRIARGFGLAIPRTIADIEEAMEKLQTSKRRLGIHREQWETALLDANRANYQRLLSARPRLADRLRPAALRRLRPEERRAFTRELIGALLGQADESPTDRSRLDRLREKADGAAAADYRMEVREAVLLRMRTLLVSAAGRAYLASRGRLDERAAFAAVQSCETLALPALHPTRPRPGKPDPYPPLESDVKLSDALRPSWLGIAFRPVAPAVRARLRLKDGAALVTSVQPGSPAERAGLAPGDIVLGEVGQPFQRPAQIRSWTMLSPRDRPLALDALRRGIRRVVQVTLTAYPQR
jgi:hypothetical protein